jgi:Uma2 family endonuclease
MSERATSRMTSDEFIIWSSRQPKGRKYELSSGLVVEMAAERARHVDVKGQVFQRLKNSVEAAQLPCQVFAHGIAVRIDDDTTFEPDVTLRCGGRVARDALSIGDPLLVVEVLSPSSRSRDINEKLAGYFRLSALRHYLVIDPDRNTIIHHERRDDGLIITHILGDQPIRLDPPGIEIADLFPAE